jgi:hypothetical protein
MSLRDYAAIVHRFPDIANFSVDLGADWTDTAQANSLPAPLGHGAGGSGNRLPHYLVLDTDRMQPSKIRTE